MKNESMSIDDPTLNLIGRSLDLRLKHQGVIASNIANADTPGFKSMKMDFEGKLQDAIEQLPVDIEVTDSGHQSLKEMIDDHSVGEVFQDPDAPIQNNGNSVNRDRELAKLAQEQQMYAATINTLNKKLAMMKYAITEGGGGR